MNLAEEAQQPEKTIPLAILLSLGISMFLYILVSLAALALMSPEQLEMTESALTDAATARSPFIADTLGGIALFSTANTALIALITVSRILYGIAEDKSLPAVFSKVLSKQQTPWVAALAAFLFSIILLPLGKVEIVAGVSSMVTMVGFLGVNLSLIHI